jgi:hypothetical protein
MALLMSVEVEISSEIAIAIQNWFHNTLPLVTMFSVEEIAPLSSTAWLQESRLQDFKILMPSKHRIILIEICERLHVANFCLCL